MNILITGITGFFGRNFVKYLFDKKINCQIIGTAHSEYKLAHFKKFFPDIKTYIIDLSSARFETDIELIIKKHNINYIVHSAAMKHVDICQENPEIALHINIISTNILIKISKRNNVNNLIALSTDKSNNPCNIYGITKYIMQENVISNGYSVYQGANFFWSDGSVLDIWYNQFMKKQPLTIRNPNHIRYFNTIDYVCDRIFKNIYNKNKIILPDQVYIIKLDDLVKAFMKYFNYDKIKFIYEYDFEKNIEILQDDSKIKKIELTQDELLKIIDKYYKNIF